MKEHAQSHAHSAQEIAALLGALADMINMSEELIMAIAAHTKDWRISSQPSPRLINAKAVLADGSAAHAAAQQRITKLEGALVYLLSLHDASTFINGEDDNQYVALALAEARLALRRPERT